MIGIIDYEMGNLRSVFNAFERLGYSSSIVHEPDKLNSFDRIILPGVGSFAKATKNLKEFGWFNSIRSFAESGRPLLGICLGMQLLFDVGEEHGINDGLSLIDGRVSLLKTQDSYRIPHVGWNNLHHKKQHLIMNGVKENIDMYFVHSYHCIPSDSSVIISTCNHGVDFVACVAKNNVAGVQFHPEKSQPAGLKILENFVEWEP